MLRQLLALLTTFLLASCVSTHDFSRSTAPNGAPDLAALKAAYQSPADAAPERQDLVSVFWFPLVHLSADGFKADQDEGYPEGGFARGRARAWGPLFFLFESESWHWNPEDELYEREETFSILWGCFRSRELLVRTDLGWRHENTVRWLWFLGRDEVEYRADAAQP